MSDLKKLQQDIEQIKKSTMEVGIHGAKIMKDIVKQINQSFKPPRQ